MKNVYTVEIETINNKNIEHFWAYLGCGHDKEKALKVAEMLSDFITYVEYPTKIVVYKEDETKKGNLINKEIISTTFLKDENGLSAIKIFNSKNHALEYWEKNYPFHIHCIEEIDNRNFILKIKEYNEHV